MNAAKETIEDSTPDKSGTGITNSANIKLSQNFYLNEFTASQDAESMFKLLKQNSENKSN